MLRFCWALARLLRRTWRWLYALPRRAAVGLGAEGLGHPARPALLWWTLVLVMPVAMFAWWAMPQITLVMSPSVDAWAVRPAPGPIVKGDYVQFMLSHPVAGPEPVSVTKLAMCMPGERLATIERSSISAVNRRDGYYYCNGDLLGVSLPLGLHGVKLEHFHWSGIIPPGMAYVGSHHPRGFDSRYFGLVPLRKLQRMKRLL
jgi:conjugal transfer pilin signal peptidase TrbI